MESDGPAPSDHVGSWDRRRVALARSDHPRTWTAPGSPRRTSGHAGVGYDTVRGLRQEVHEAGGANPGAGGRTRRASRTSRPSLRGDCGRPGRVRAVPPGEPRDPGCARRLPCLSLAGGRPRRRAPAAFAFTRRSCSPSSRMTAPTVAGARRRPPIGPCPRAMRADRSGSSPSRPSPPLAAFIASGAAGKAPGKPMRCVKPVQPQEPGLRGCATGPVRAVHLCLVPGRGALCHDQLTDESWAPLVMANRTPILVRAAAIWHRSRKRT